MKNLNNILIKYKEYFKKNVSEFNVDFMIFNYVFIDDRYYSNVGVTVFNNKLYILYEINKKILMEIIYNIEKIRTEDCGLKINNCVFVQPIIFNDSVINFLNIKKDVFKENKKNCKMKKLLYNCKQLYNNFSKYKKIISVLMIISGTQVFAFDDIISEGYNFLKSKIIKH